MTLEERVDRLEQEWGKNDAFVLSVRQNMAILAEMEARSSDRLREQERQSALQERQSALLESRIAEHDRWIEESKALGRETDRRIGDLVSAMGAFIGQQKPGRA
jgi:hypothetical protein